MSETESEYETVESLAIIEKAETFSIVDMRSFDESNEIILELARAIKQKKAIWSTLVLKAKATYDEAKSGRDSELKPLEDMADHVSKMRTTWKMLQDRLVREEQARLDKIKKDKAEAERQKLLEKAAAMEEKNPKKAEELFQKAEDVVEELAFAEKTIEKTTKLESGGSITWIYDINIEVIDKIEVCKAIVAQLIPEKCLGEFVYLKKWAELNGMKEKVKTEQKGIFIYGLHITEKQRESNKV